MCVHRTDLICEHYGQCVRIVNRGVVRMKGQVDIHALFWTNGTHYWNCTEHTQPAVVLGSCILYRETKTMLSTMLRFG